MEVCAHGNDTVHAAKGESLTHNTNLIISLPRVWGYCPAFINFGATSQGVILAEKLLVNIIRMNGSGWQIISFAQPSRMPTLLLSPLSPTAHWYMDGAWVCGVDLLVIAIEHTIILAILWLLRRKIKNGIRNMMFGFARDVCINVEWIPMCHWPQSLKQRVLGTSGTLNDEYEFSLCTPAKPYLPQTETSPHSLINQKLWVYVLNSLQIPHRSLCLSHSRSLLTWTFSLFAFW